MPRIFRAFIIPKRFYLKASKVLVMTFPALVVLGVSGITFKFEDHSRIGLVDRNDQKMYLFHALT